MAKSNTDKIKVTELDFDLIKQSLKDFLKGQSQFSDYDLEGSGMSVLLDLLAYNTHHNGFYTNMVANEQFLDSASNRDSVVSTAAQLGYVPRSVTSPRATVDVTFNPNDLGGYDDGAATPTVRLGTSVIIPKGSVFITELANKTYSFVTTTSYTATPTANSTAGYLVNDSATSEVVPYIASSVEIVQGVYSSIQYVFNEQIAQTFLIPSVDVDTTTISILVSDSVAGTAGVVYTLAEEYTKLNGESAVFFVQEVRNGNYEIYFGDGTIGKKPVDGSIIDISYVVSEGVGSNDATIFGSDPIKSPFYGISASTRTYSPTVTTILNATGGDAKETIESIKFLAPRNFESQNRAVTAGDYEVKLQTDYTNLDAVHVWGGEENDPPDYGKVYISIKPKSGYVLTDTDKKHIAANILKTRNMLTVTPVFVDPTFLYLVLSIDTKWDSRLTTLTGEILKLGIVDEVTTFGQDTLEKFDSYFRYSNLLRTIEDFDAGIVNGTVGLKLRAEFTPTLGVSENYTIKFSNPLNNTGLLTSTTFDYGGFTGCVIFDKDDGSGVLEIYGNSPTGQNVLVSGNAGTIDYNTGTVVLTSFAPTAVSSGGIISITVQPLEQDIVPGNNQLVTIKESDVSITMLDDASASTGTLQTTRTQVGPS